MNEMVPWGTRVRDGATATSRRVGTAVRSAWQRFTDLGIGAVFLSLGVLVAVGIGVAVVQGRSGPTPSACDAAAPYLTTIQRLEQRGRPLTATQVTTLDDASTRLADIARTAPGSARSAVTHASQVAAGARAGQVLDARTVLAQYQEACDFGGGGGEGGGPGGSGF